MYVSTQHSSIAWNVKERPLVYTTDHNVPVWESYFQKQCQLKFVNLVSLEEISVLTEKDLKDLLLPIFLKNILKNFPFWYRF